MCTVFLITLYVHIHEHCLEGCTGRHDVRTKGLRLPTEQPTHRCLFRKLANIIM